MKQREKSKDEKFRDEKMINKTFICLKCFFRVPKIDFVYEKNKKMLVYFCQCGEQYSNTISSYITSLAKLRIKNEIKGKCSSKLHPEATASFFCFECQKAFCEECAKYHNEYNKSHYTVEKIKPAIINKCFTHNIPNKYYCTECNLLCCEKCKGKHANHSMTNIYKEKSIYSKGELSQKEKVIGQIDEYIKYVEDVYQNAKENYENLFGDQPGNYYEDAIKRLYDEERLIQLMYNNISIEPENITSYINLNTIEKIFPLHIIKDEINKTLYFSFFKKATLFYKPHVEQRISNVLKFWKKKKITISVLISNDGIFYGEVTDDQKNGQGLISLNEEEVYEGKWENNILITKIRIKTEEKKKGQKGKDRKTSTSEDNLREEKIKREIGGWLPRGGRPIRGMERRDRTMRGRGGRMMNESRSNSQSSEGLNRYHEEDNDNHSEDFE